MRSLVGIVAAVALAACGGSPASPPPLADDGPTPGGTVVLGALTDVQSWNPYLAESLFADQVLEQIYPRLMIEQPDYREHPPTFAPSLARSWELSADGLELTLHLEPDATWSDGVPVTADDVVFSHRVALSPEVGWLGADAKAQIAEVEAVDPKTVLVRFSRRSPYQLMDANAGPIVPAHAWAEVPLASWRSVDWKERMLSAGPFRLASHVPQQEIVLERNPTYWRAGLPRLERVVWRIVPSKGGLLNLLLAGDLDLHPSVPPGDAERVATDPELELREIPSRTYSFVLYNLRRPMLDEPVERRALSLAVDRRAIVEAVYGGHARIAAGPILSEMWAFNRDMAPLPHDPGRARELLDAAGWRDSDGDGIRELDGTPFRLELLAPSENELRQDIAVLIEQDLARIGVDATPRFVEWGTLLARLDAGDFDAAIHAWSEPTMIDLGGVWHSTGPDEPTFNWGGYADPEVDRLLELAAEEPDPAVQKPLYDRVQELVVADQPYTFLAESLRLVGVHRRIRGADINDASPYFNLEQWWVSGGR